MLDSVPCAAHHCQNPQLPGLPFCTECWAMVSEHFRHRIKPNHAPAAAVIYGAIDEIRWKRECRANAALREKPAGATARETA